MDRIASRPPAVAVVLRENFELTVPIVVNSVMRVRLLLLLVWWVDALDALPVHLARQRGKHLTRHVKIAVLEKLLTWLVQAVNRLAKIV